MFNSYKYMKLHHNSMKQSYSVRTILVDCTHVYTYIQIVNTHIKCYIGIISSKFYTYDHAKCDCLHRITPAYLITVAQYMCLDTEVHTCIGYLFVIESKRVNVGYNFSV